MRGKLWSSFLIWLPEAVKGGGTTDQSGMPANCPVRQASEKKKQIFQHTNEGEIMVFFKILFSEEVKFPMSFKAELCHFFSVPLQPQSASPPSE